MKAVITGASGFIGSHLVDSLLYEGYHVVALGRSFPGLISKEALNNSRLDIVAVDIEAKSDINNVIKGADFVFHLASGSLPQTSNLNPHADIRVNLLGSLNLLDSCVSNQIKKFIFLSSGGTVYGIPKLVPINEDHPTDPLCSYGITKLAIEKYVALYRELYDLNAVILRVANPYGGRQRLDSNQGVVPIFLSRVLRSESLNIWGDGSIVRDFLYIEDLINAIITSSKYDGPEHIFNIGSGSGLSLCELIDIIRQVVQKDVDVTYLPARDFDVTTNVLSINKARECLGWSPKVSVVDGVTRFYRSILS